MSDHEAAEPSFFVRMPIAQDVILGPGARMSIEYPDGKGVSGLLAGVDIAPGGSSFRLVVTHDGRWPDDRPEIAPDEANDSQGDDTLADTEARLRERLKATEVRAAQLYADNERLRANNLSTRAANARQVERIRELRIALTDTQTENARQAGTIGKLQEERDAALDRAADLDTSRQQEARRADEMHARAREAEDEICLLRAERDSRVAAPKSHNVFYTAVTGQGVISADSIAHEPQEKPRQRVITQHDPDGSVTIRVEPREN